MGHIEYNKHDIYWEQYILETKEWYLAAGLGRKVQLNRININQKTQEVIKEVFKILIEKNPAGNAVQEQQVMLELIVEFIFVALTPKQLENETLIQRTWSRHALLNEVVWQLEKILIYKRRSFSKEQKKKLFLLSLEILDCMVQSEVVKQEMVVVADNVTENPGEEQKPEHVGHEEMPLSSKKAGSKYKTIYIYQTNIEFKLPLGLTHWNVSIIPMTEILLAGGSIYIMGATLKSLHKVTLENRYNNKHIILEDITIINKLRGLKLYLNTELYKIMNNGLAGTYEAGQFNVRSILKRVKEDIKQLSCPVYRLKNGGAEEGGQWKIDQKKTQAKKKNLQKRINKQLILLDFCLLGSFDKLFERPLYFYYMLDFRGRLYYKSRISPQNTYIFRYIYDYGANNAKEAVGVALPIDYKKWNKVIDKTLNTEAKYTEQAQRIRFWLVIEFAKIYKSVLGEPNKGVLSIEDLINIGCEALTQKPSVTLDPEKMAQKSYVYYIWDELTAKGGLKRQYIIYKDATASAIQLITLYLVPTNEEIAEYANLKSLNKWYDTYMYVIQLFLKRYTIESNSAPFFTRNNLKKTIMTYNYSATLHTCWAEFVQQIKEQNQNYDASVIRDLKKDFKRFYEFLDEFFNKQGTFLSSFDLIAQKQINSYALGGVITFQSTDKATIYLHYQENTLKRWTMQRKNERKTIQMLELKEKLDLKKTKQSLKPNTTHAIDAALIRETLRDLNQPIMTIHDCYGVNIQTIDETIFSINKNINNIKRYREAMPPSSWFSIFIVL